MVAFHRDGLCQLTDKKYSLKPSEVAATQAYVSKLFNSTLLSLSQRDLLEDLREVGFDSFKMRQHEVSHAKRFQLQSQSLDSTNVNHVTLHVFFHRGTI